MLYSCQQYRNQNKYLIKVLGNLELIHSASYLNTVISYTPGNDSPNFVQKRYYKELSNPYDTTIGSNFSYFDPFDTSVNFDWSDKMIVIDSFKLNTLPFRPVTPPFFNLTKSIIEYALETNDSISLKIESYGDSLLFSLVIYGGKQVEFFGKPYYIDNPYRPIDGESKYFIWISKSDDLPFKLRREMSYDIYEFICSDVKLNPNYPKVFAVSDYFPDDFTISYKRMQPFAQVNMQGKHAPDWTLHDAENKSFSLKDFNSKVLMIKFTGIGCGPCNASIPFIKKLVNEYKAKSFEFISIETWSNNPAVIKNYCNNNGLNFKYLISTNDVVRNYNAEAVPVFFIIDEKRVIRKVIRGYREGTTDQEIIKTLNELI